MARDQGLSPCPILTALAQFIQGALLLDQIPLRHRKLCARGLQLRLCPKAWEKGGHPDPTTGTSSNPGNNPRPRAAHSPQAPPPQPTCLTAAIAGSDLLFQDAQLRRLLRGWNDPRPPHTRQVIRGNSLETLPHSEASAGDPGIPSHPQTQEPRDCTHRSFPADPGGGVEPRAAKRLRGERLL